MRALRWCEAQRAPAQSASYGGRSPKPMQRKPRSASRRPSSADMASMPTAFPCARGGGCARPRRGSAGRERRDAEELVRSPWPIQSRSMPRYCDLVDVLHPATDSTIASRRALCDAPSWLRRRRRPSAYMGPKPRRPAAGTQQQPRTARPVRPTRPSAPSHPSRRRRARPRSCDSVAGTHTIGTMRRRARYASGLVSVDPGRVLLVEEHELVSGRCQHARHAHGREPTEEARDELAARQLVLDGVLLHAGRGAFSRGCASASGLSTKGGTRRSDLEDAVQALRARRWSSRA